MADAPRIERLRVEMESLLRDLASELVRQWSEGAATSRLGAILGSRPSLGGDAFRIVEDAMGSAAGDATGGLLRLRAAAARFAEELASAEDVDRACALGSTPRDTPGTGPLPPFRIPSRAAAEPDRGLREALAAAWDAVAAAARPHLERGLGRAWDASRRLGPESYVDAWTERTGIDHRAMVGEARTLLAGSADLARDAVLDLVSRRIGARAPRWHDVLHATCSGPIPEALPAGYAPVACKLFLGAVGIDNTAAGRIRIESAPSAPPDAGAIAISVPHDVRVPSRGAWGLPALRSYLRDLGMALHLAHVDAGLPFEQRGLLDPALPGSTGVLLEHLAATPTWLARVAKVPQPRDAARIPALLSLLHVRRSAAALVGQVELAGNGRMREARDLGEDLAAQALTVPCAEAALDVLAPRFPAATELRASAVGLHAAHTLRDRFDEDWFRNPGAGAHLLGLWRQGGTLALSDVVPGAPTLAGLPAIFEALLA